MTTKQSPAERLESALRDYGWILQRYSPESSDRVRGAFKDAKQSIITLIDELMGEVIGERAIITHSRDISGKIINVTKEEQHQRRQATIKGLRGIK